MKTLKFQIIRMNSGKKESFILGEKQTAYFNEFRGNSFVEDGRKYTYLKMQEARRVQKRRGWRTYPEKFVYTYELGEGRFKTADGRWDGVFEAPIGEAREIFKRVLKNSRKTANCDLPALHLVRW